MEGGQVGERLATKQHWLGFSKIGGLFFIKGRVIRGLSSPATELGRAGDSRHALAHSSGQLQRLGVEQKTPLLPLSLPPRQQGPAAQLVR